jgi:hypothetical protein
VKYQLSLVSTLALSGLVLTGCPSDSKPTPAPTPSTSTSTAPAPAPSAPTTAEAPAPGPGPTAGTKPDGAGGDNGGQEQGGHHDGVASELGEIDLDGFKLQVTQFGELEAGDALAANVGGDIPAGAALYAWIADAKDDPLGAPATSEKDPETGLWHFHLAQDDEEAEPVWLYLRIRGGGKDARTRVLLNGAEEPPPHGGSAGGMLPAGDDDAIDPVGSVEAVWEPATGTLKLWFYDGQGFGTPMPIDASAGVIALLDESPLELQVKDAAAGHAEITGEEALKDADLTPMLVVMFTSGGKEFKSELLVLEHE